ncbi:short chain dehydrogenase [Hirsutella rhossiliensis]|uniref:Short chain dehydrogenase domain-containing protein n=1 Tax=Hirsutella rhossiliensis TaxID=111463 RepID=A0A9P8SDX3_9HYPO|nr:short chain dehydrogenase domain-containing protein [Hirsutella rhossiliensis]KAH0959208.1 short chain dehydrogenase domain-containing protein [Hirsutella rhossiliensis]
MPGKIILVTGTSSGFGNLAVLHLAKAGHTVYASMRQLESKNAQVATDYKDFCAKNSVDIRPLELDVSEQKSSDEAIKRIISESGRLDVIVHNAGHMCFGPLESFTAEELARYYDINTLGPHRVNSAALPHMRKAGTGQLVWIGSSSTSGGTPPFLGPYFAAKSGMDSLAVSYASELSKWGISTTIVVPGVFTSGTNHFAHAGKGSKQAIEKAYFEGPYHGVAERSMKGMEKGDAEGDVTDVAKAVVDVVGARQGKAPFRVHIDPWNDGAENVNKVRDQMRVKWHQKTGLEDLLQVKAPGA